MPMSNQEQPIILSGEDAIQKNVTILVLGANGMLGSMVYRYFKHCYDCNVIGTSLTPQKDLITFDAYQGFERCPIRLEDVDYVINCIGIIKPYCHDDNQKEVEDAIYVNALFPHKL